MNLLIVIPFCARDLNLARNLLAWVDELGKLPENDCLLVEDAKLTAEQSKPIEQTASSIFKSVSIVRTPFSLPDEKWPIGANWMWEIAAKWIEAQNPSPWLWLEPDAVPMREGWLKELEVAVAASGKPFLGQIIKPKQPGLPEKMLSGVAVYPAKLPNAIWVRLLQTKRKVAWDVACAGTIVPLTEASSLIWNFHNREMPPTFVRKRHSSHPVNAIEIGIIPKQAVLAHTCKDGSLISLLRGDGEPDIGQIYMVWKTQFEGHASAISTWKPRTERIRYVHCVERHANGDMEALKRSTTAFQSWITLYRTGRLVPCHVWRYPRSSAALGDPRTLPHLKDVLVEGMTKAGERDVIVLTNDDTVLHPSLLGALDDKLKTVDACSSFRLNFETLPNLKTSLADIIRTGKPDLGRDLFAFRKSWLKEHWFNLPDFFLGELEWDLVVSVMIRRSAGIFTDRSNLQEPMPACEIEKGFVLHEKHVPKWTQHGQKQSPAKVWNKRLAIDWYSSNGFASLISSF